jgi:two-component system, OmpR family, phosphate regulon sensor histidine kinase PhoR
MNERLELWLWGLALFVLSAALLSWWTSGTWKAGLICGISGLFVLTTAASRVTAGQEDARSMRGQPAAGEPAHRPELTQNATPDEDAGAALRWREEGTEPSPGLSSANLSALLEALPEAAIIVSRGRITHSNHAAQTLLGGHIDGADLRLAVRHPAAVGLLGSDSADQPMMTELVGLGAPGQSWQLRVMPIDGGRRLATFTDISTMRAAERMRADFVANASHELRTPLAALTGFIETLTDPVAGGDDATRNRFLTIMEREAHRMRRLVDDLISLSRIEAERYRLPDEPVSLLSLAEEVRAVLRDNHQPRGLDIAPVLVTAGQAMVRGDRAQLSQLLYNLLDNALKYGQPGTPVQISLSPAPGGMIALAISDEGEGIAQEHLPRLTERFYRVDSGRSRALGGTGLGLAIVKHIVERHRGHFRVDSVAGQGTTVHVRLPVLNTPEQLSQI